MGFRVIVAWRISLSHKYIGEVGMDGGEAGNEVVLVGEDSLLSSINTVVVRFDKLNVGPICKDLSLQCLGCGIVQNVELWVVSTGSE